MPFPTFTSTVIRGVLPLVCGLALGRWMMPGMAHQNGAGEIPRPTQIAATSDAGRAPVSAPLVLNGSAALEAVNPGTFKERLAALAKNRRVEELFLEIQKLPPGEDRRQASGLLMREWFPMDREAALRWMDTLTEPAEKESAHREMLISWCKDDSHAASASVAAMPEGPARKSAGKVLCESLVSLDPASSLIWSMASRLPEENLDYDVTGKVRNVARADIDMAIRLLAESPLTEAEQVPLREAARTSWNQQRMLEGQWDQIKPEVPEP